jgi:hypothetical protein
LKISGRACALDLAPQHPIAIDTPADGDRACAKESH